MSSYNSFTPNFNQGDETSKFNDGYLQMLRLNFSWISCKNYSTKGMLEQWKRELEAVWLELSGDAIKLQRHAKGEEPDLTKNIWFKKNELLNRSINIASKLKKRDALYNLLTQKEIFLRDLQLKSGKAGKYAEKDEARL
jgi:hypothetical protein